MTEKSKEPNTNARLTSALMRSEPSACLPANANRFASATPMATPISPPTKPKNPDSMKNKVKIELFLAPIDFMMPISFVLSRTAVYIVFVIPMPPTTREINAIIEIKSCTPNNTSSRLSRALSGLCTVKSSSPSFTPLSFLRSSSTFLFTFPIDLRSFTFIAIAFTESSSLNSLISTSSFIITAVSKIKLPFFSSMPTTSNCLPSNIMLFPTCMGFPNLSSSVKLLPKTTLNLSPSFSSLPWLTLRFSIFSNLLRSLFSGTFQAKTMSCMSLNSKAPVSM